MATVSEFLIKMRRAFQFANIAESEAKILLSGLLGFSTLDLVTRHDFVLSKAQLQDAEGAISKRLSGMPVYRILGWREFYGLRFELSEGTLEPRPDTEILVDHMIPIVQDVLARKGSCRILDLGTGTGAIALSLLHHCDGATAIGVDQSDDALKTARSNAESLGLLDRFQILKSDWMSNVDGQFDVIASNPPYIATDIVDGLSREVKDHDPILALDGGQDGLDVYRHLSQILKPFLNSNSVIGFEIGFDQNDSVREIFENMDFQLIGAHKDLSGQDRVLIFSEM